MDPNFKSLFRDIYFTLCNSNTEPFFTSSYVNHWVRLHNFPSTSFFFCVQTNTYPNQLDFICCLDAESFEPLHHVHINKANVDKYIRDVSMGFNKRQRKIFLKVLKSIFRAYTYPPTFFYPLQPLYVFGKKVEAPFEQCALKDVDKVWFKLENVDKV